MKNLNIGAFTGRIGRAFELRRVPGKDTAVTENALAVTTGYGDNEGTAWIPLTFWGKHAENACQYLEKGREIHVTGRWQQDNWTDKQTGAKRSLLRLIVDDWGFIGPKPEGVGQGSAGAPPAPASGGGGAREDDIPF